MKKNAFKNLIGKEKAKNKDVGDFLKKKHDEFLRKKSAWDGLSNDLKLLIAEPLQEYITDEQFNNLED